MRNRLIVVTVVILAIALCPFAGGALPQERPVVVPAAWLADRLSDERLVVLHVGDERSWREGHIPGASLFPTAAFVTERDGLTMEMPDPAALEEALEGAGVTEASHIVLYAAGQPPRVAARLYVTLARAGLGERASVLDGGLDAWRAEARPVTTEATAPRRGSVRLAPREDVLVDHAWVGERLGRSDLAVVDARAPRFWSGAEWNRQRAARPGRIPGALNVPFEALVDEDGRMRPKDALAALFAEAGVAPGQPLVAYCHVGLQASLLFVAARHLGHEVRLYDGSFEDWSRRAELPVEGPRPSGGP